MEAEKKAGAISPDDFFMTDDGLVRIGDLDRDGLLKVIGYLRDENAVVRSHSEQRLELLKGHWGVRR